MDKTIKRNVGRNLLIAALILLCVFELWGLAKDVFGFHGSSENYLNYQHGRLVRVPETLTPNEIAPWMTFSYINFVFKLSPDYLKNTLALSDPRYPNIQIQRYARMHGGSAASLLASVQQAVAAAKP